MIQMRSLILALAVGAGLGLAYDLLRPIRARAGKPWTIIPDIVFCAFSGTAAFFYAMGAGNGRMGICQLGAMTAGFLLYLYIFSDKVLTFLRRLTQKKEIS